MSRLPSRRVTDFAVTHRRALAPPVAGYIRMRYRVGRRTARALAAMAFGSLRALRVARRVGDTVTWPVRLIGRGARRVGSITQAVAGRR